MRENSGQSDVINNTQSGRTDAENVQDTLPSTGAGADTGITGDDGPGGGMTGAGSGLPDVVASGTGGPNSDRPASTQDT